MKTLVESPHTLGSIAEVAELYQRPGMYLSFQARSPLNGDVAKSRDGVHRSVLASLRKVVDSRELFQRSSEILHGLKADGGLYLVVVGEDQSWVTRLLDSKAALMEPQYSEMPYLLPAVPTLTAAKTLLSVNFDRVDAHVGLHTLFKVEELETIEGDGFDVHKSKADNAFRSRHQDKVEHNWKKNWSSASRRVVKLVVEYKPDEVYVNGDSRALEILDQNLHSMVPVNRLDVGVPAKDDLEMNRRVHEVIYNKLVAQIESQQRSAALQISSSAIDSGRVSVGPLSVVESIKHENASMLLLTETPSNNDIFALALRHGVKVVTYPANSSSLRFEGMACINHGKGF